ncbi:MAG: O-antigen ligase family protein [Anaerovibrio sp.]|nr:O-antigen ligase family protein [Anaerovibrio sp.]
MASSRAVQDGIYFSILLVAFFIGLSPTVAIVFLGIGTGLFFLRLWKDPGTKMKETYFRWFIVVYLIFGAASILVSPDRLYSLSVWYVLVLIYLFTYILISQNVTSREQVKHIAYALGISAALVVLYGFFQFIFGIDTSDMKWVDGEAFPELRNRVFSTWENPNILAAYLDIVVCVLLGMFTHIQGRKIWILMLVGILCSLGCLAMTYARGACLTMAVIMLGYGAFKDKRILLGTLVLVIGALALNPVLFERMSTVFSMADTSSEMRIAMWESTIQMIMDHPIFGIGGGAYSLVYPIYDTYIVDGSVTLVHAHNIYLNYLAEVGIIGGMSFLMIFLGNMFMALFPQRELPDDFTRGMMAGLGLALVSVALNGLTDDVLFNIPSSMLLWLMFGLVYVLKEKI